MTYNALGGVVVDEAAVEACRAKVAAEAVAKGLPPFVTDRRALMVLVAGAREVEERKRAEQREARRSRRRAR